MAKTKAMCIIYGTSKWIGIQHEMKHGKGSKNSSISLIWWKDNWRRRDGKAIKWWHMTDMINVPISRMTMIFALE